MLVHGFACVCSNFYQPWLLWSALFADMISVHKTSYPCTMLIHVWVYLTHQNWVSFPLDCHNVHDEIEPAAEYGASCHIQLCWASRTCLLPQTSHVQWPVTETCESLHWHVYINFVIMDMFGCTLYCRASSCQFLDGRLCSQMAYMYMYIHVLRYVQRFDFNHPKILLCKAWISTLCMSWCDKMTHIFILAGVDCPFLWHNLHPFSCPIPTVSFLLCDWHP